MVVVVAAILFIAALPDQSAADAQRARNMAMRIESDIAYAQNLSIAEPVDPVVLRVDPVANKYWLARQSDVDTPLVDDQTGDARVVIAGESGAFAGVDIVGVDFNGDDELGFDGSGVPDQDVPALIQIQCGSAKYEVECTPTTGRSSTQSTFTKVIATDTLAAASGVTRVVGSDENIKTREKGVATDRSDVADSPGLLDGVTDLLSNLLGGG